MTNVDVRALAKLAKLEITDAEASTLERELPDILAFVETIQNAPISQDEPDRTLRNVMRDDTDAHETGMYTEVLLSAAPTVKNNRVVVKQVISRNQK